MELETLIEQFCEEIYPESVKLTEIKCNKKENNSISGFPLNEMLSA